MSGKILQTGCLPGELAKTANVAAIVNAVESGIAADAGAQAAIASAIADDLLLNAAFQAGMAAAVPAATDTVQGKVALANATETAAATDNTQALTPGNLAGALNSTTTAGGNAMQQAVTNAVQQAIGADTGAQAAIASAIADDVATALAFKDCNGGSIPQGASLATCANLSAAIAGGAAPSGAAGGALTGTYPNPGLNITAVKAAETTTTLAASGVNYVYTNEDGIQTVIQPVQFLSSDAGNALATGADGRLKVSIPAQLPDDQVLSGDNSGTVALTLTPTVVAGQTNYTIKGDLKVAAQTPDGETNLLKPSASGFYVDADDVANAIAGDTTAKSTLSAALVDNLGATAAETIAGDIDNKLVSPADLRAALGSGEPYGIHTLAAVRHTTSTASPGFQNTDAGYLMEYGDAGTTVLSSHAGGGAAFIANHNRTGGQTYVSNFLGTAVGSITVTATGAAYGTISDYRLKTVDGPVVGSGAFIDALKPYVGEWNAEPGKKARFFLAHEVQEVSPSTVSGEKDAVDADGKPLMQSMEYGSADFIVNIVAELQDLRKRMAALEAK